MANRVRITGLVRLAEGVRRELAGPLPDANRDRLRARVTHSLQQVEQIVRHAGSKVDWLPEPSRRAVQFLQSIEWERLPVATDGLPAAAQRQITWPGLARYVDRLMDQLSGRTSERELEAVRESIAKMSRQMEGTIERQKLSPQDLMPTSRELRAWLNFFSRPESITLYAQAEKLARAAIDPETLRQKRFPPPLRIHFRPMRGIFKIRGSRRGSVLTLPTPMVVFGAPEFAELAALIFRTGAAARQKVLEQMTAEGYQAVLAELEALSGIMQQVRGAFHDLGASFDRVNARYFGGAMARPRLTWSRSFTGRKFGHYDWILDTVMVSRTLDVDPVQSFIVDYIVYHELLHKKHGLSWVNGRGYAHTAEFYREERAFEQYAQADATIERLARHGVAAAALPPLPSG